MITKAHRVAAGCRTPAQAAIAWRWLLLAAKRDSRLESLLPYYADQLNQLSDRVSAEQTGGLAIPEDQSPC